MRRGFRALAAAFVCVVVMGSDCQDNTDTPTTTTSAALPTTTAPPGVPGENVGHSPPVIVPAVHDQRRRYGVLGVGSDCASSTLGQTIVRYTRQVPKGYACDPWMWNAGGLTAPSDFDVVVRYTLATCNDPWIVQATIEQLGRLPQTAECRIALYNRGTWNSYDELSRYVRELSSVSVANETNPTRWEVMVLVYEKATMKGETRTMCEPSPCSDAWYRSLNARLDELAAVVANGTGGQVQWRYRVQRARVPLPDKGADQGFAEAAPVAADSELRGFVAQNQFDSIIVVQPGYRLTPLQMAAPYFGQGSTILTGDAAKIGSQGATYAWVVGPPPARTWDEPAPGKLFVERILHEWLHGVEFFYRSKGFTAELPTQKALFNPSCFAPERADDPSLVHASGVCFGHRYSSGESTTLPFGAYVAFLKGELRHGGTFQGRSSFGVTTEMWASGGPRSTRRPFQ